MKNRTRLWGVELRTSWDMESGVIKVMKIMILQYDLVLRRLSQPTASSAEPAKIFNRANVTRLT